MRSSVQRRYALIQLLLNGITTAMPIAAETSREWCETYEQFADVAQIDRHVAPTDDLLALVADRALQQAFARRTQTWIGRRGRTSSGPIVSVLRSGCSAAVVTAIR